MPDVRGAAVRALLILPLLLYVALAQEPQQTFGPKGLRYGWWGLALVVSSIRPL